MSSDKQFAQAFIELRAADPEALSAYSVAHATLESGQPLLGVRRFRVFELAGSLPPKATLSELLHRSTQFYNPSKERCVVRSSSTDPTPATPDEQLVLIFDRGGERRVGAERWWRGETGARIEVREGVCWALRFAPELSAPTQAEALTVMTDREHGLLCNPNSQEWRGAVAPGTAPLPWISTKPMKRGPRARKGKTSP